ncbi:fructuronate reductase [Palleronia aestuarii]|uniref:Fructuronate reductase n=1 Tax=Palleronia aestuarii TaxID=568105 RepID=A0A2W7MVN7_9RHOB|nr:mannitol dehydrogenase family protein [Palleronia aestuarii]PZX11701.1 fructuronate reductase [Palleronia aestuarii]
MSEQLKRTRPAPAPGIVHFGLGAFWRAFGALFVEEAVREGGGDWGIVGVSLKSPSTRDALRPQDWTYTTVELGPEGETPRHVQILSDVIVAPEAPEALFAALETAQLVTLTVTEKGYCHVPATGRLNRDHPDIAQDLAEPDRPASAPGFITRALDVRRKAGRPPFTVMSCDNIPSNGELLRGVVLDLAAEIDADLRDWIAAEVSFPSTMVDRIVPALAEGDVDDVAVLTGYRDAAPVKHEPFRQWVVEDSFCAPRPDFGAVGAEMVADVAPYEHMKLRCLNGAHSSLAYLGYLAGAETMADAVARPALAGYVRHLWAQEITPVLTAPPGVDLSQYTDTLLERFANPAIRHRTWQIAMDGSQKLPQRILDTVRECLDAGRAPDGLLLAIAAWMQFTSGTGLDGEAIEVKDPLADRLRACWEGSPSEEDVVRRYLALEEIFEPAFAARPEVVEGLTLALGRLRSQGAEAAAEAATG